MTLSVWWCGVVHGVNVKFSKFHVLFWSGNTGAIHRVHDYNSTYPRIRCSVGTLVKRNFVVVVIHSDASFCQHNPQ